MVVYTCHVMSHTCLHPACGVHELSAFDDGVLSKSGRCVIGRRARCGPGRAERLILQLPAEPHLMQTKVWGKELKGRPHPGAKSPS